MGEDTIDDEGVEGYDDDWYDDRKGKSQSDWDTLMSGKRVL